MFTHWSRYRAVVAVLIGVAAVCADPWINVAAAQAGRAAGGAARGGRAASQDDGFVLAIYKIEHSQPISVHGVLNSLISGRLMKVAIDVRTNALLIYAEPQTHEKIQSLVALLDVPATATKPKPVARGRGAVRGAGRGGGRTSAAPAPQPTPVELRIFWLASEMPSLNGSKDLPADLKPVADALAKKDIKDLRLVGQMMINTVSDSGYNAVASPMLGGNVVDLSVAGVVSKNPESLNITIRLAVTREEKSSTGITSAEKDSDTAYRTTRLAKLETHIFAQSGEYTVLGLTPVEGITSVFVVQANLIE